MARTGNVFQPLVEGPPLSVLKRDKAIQAETGMPAADHHTRIRSAVEAVTFAASEAQQDVVRRIEAMAWDTRFSIEKLASDIPGVVAGAIAYIQGSINRAKEDITQSADTQAQRIRDHQMAMDANLTTNRDTATAQVQQQLLAGSQRIREFNTELQQRFDAKLGEAAIRVREVPRTGTARLLEGAAQGGGARGGGGQGGGGAQGAGGGQGGGGGPAGGGGGQAGGARGARLIPEVGKRMVDALVASSRASAGIVPFEDLRCSQVLPGLIEARQTTMVNGATQRATQLGSEATRARFTIAALGLTAPVAQEVEHDAPGDTRAETSAVAQQQQQQLSAKDRAVQDLTQKRDGAHRFLDQLRPRLEASIYRVGRQVENALRNQARVAEVGIASSAAPMATSYPDIVRRLEPLVAPGRFLDSRVLLPQIEAARQSALSLRAQQLQTVGEQAEETLAGAQESFRQQSEQIRKAAHESTSSVDDSVIQCAFDFELAADQFTGQLVQGTQSAVARALGYAERMADRLLKDTQRIRTGLTPLEERAIAFLNGAISTEAAIYAESVSSTETELNAPRGPLFNTREQVRADLSQRATRVHQALPSRSTGAAIGLMVASPVVGLAYLYYTDADENSVLSTLGELPWPGPAAIAEAYQTLRGYGNLESHIRERLGDPEKGQALGLLSASAGRRASARMDIARESTGLIFGPSRETREAVLRGFSQEERDILPAAELERTRQVLRNELRGGELTISESYLDRNAGRALAVRIQERMQRARAEGDDAIVRAMDDIQTMARTELGGSVNSAFVSQAQVDQLLGRALREHAVLTGQHQGPISELSEERARTLFAEQATAARTVYEVHGHGEFSEVRERQVAVSPEATAAVRATILHGAQSEEAQVARAAYELTRAEGDGKPSETTQMRLTTALEDPAFARMQRQYDEETDPVRRAALAGQLEEARRAHEHRLESLATALGATPEQIRTAGGAQAYLSNRVGNVFGRLGTTGRRYGEEMITQGRASLRTGVRLATEGAGTHEDLLRHTYTGRSRQEIQRGRELYQRETGENMDAMLGLSGDRWFTEVSGDLLFQLQELSLGEPQTDADFAEVAALRYRQQRAQGTGWLSSMTMQGSTEQQVLDADQSQMSQLIISALASNGMPGVRPEQLFNADGTLRLEYRRAAFNERGELRGTPAQQASLRDYTQRVGMSSEAYKAEIDRQESILTSAITALAIAITVVLMIVPGVNVVAAGVLTALITGAATVAVKAGMRGGRYGWEEAAVDVGMTAIEAATAGFGGAMAGGLGKAGMAGRFARVGEALTARFGRAGAAAIREGITGAINSASQVALQDETWKDGPGTGLLRVLGGGVKGAAVGAVSGGVSEGVEGQLKRVMQPNLVDPAAGSRLQRAMHALGPGGRDLVREALSEAVGGMASEATSIFADVVSGDFHGTLGDALKRMGQAGLRDLISATGRTLATAHNRARYQDLLGRARDNPHLSDSDLRALRLAAISAGSMQYGEGLDHVRQEVELGRAALADFPEDVRRRFAGLDAGTLQGIRGQIDSGTLGTPEQRLKLLETLSETMPGLDARKLLADLQSAESGVRAAEVQAEQRRKQQNQVRGQLGSQLEGPLRRYLSDVPVEGLETLPRTDMRRAAEMIRNGEFDEKVARELLAAARAGSPDVDEKAFLGNLRQAVESVQRGQEVERAIRAQQRSDVLAAVPEAGRGAFADLPQESIRTVQRLLDSGSQGTPQQREALFRAARQQSPDLDRATFLAHLDAAVRTVAEARNEVRRARRQERFERMEEYPDHVRGPLSALPDFALIELRVARMRGEELSPRTRQALVDAARAETPGVDVRRLNAALDEAVRQPARPVEGAEAEKMRSELLAAVPTALRSKLGEVPILVMRSGEFEAFTRSATGEAVTLIIQGRPVVVLREGADPKVLREEGLHAVQAQDPRWREHIGSLDESRLANWDKLPLEEQFALYRNKLDLEIDAQRTLLGGLEVERARAELDPGEATALRRRIEQTEATLENLMHRRAEVDSVTPTQIRAMEAGLGARMPEAEAVTTPRQPQPVEGVPIRPQYLDQPPRLFNKGPREGIEIVRGKVRLRGVEIDDSPLNKQHEGRVYQVGDYFEEHGRTYRLVVQMDENGRVARMREEILREDNGNWVQRGSEGRERGIVAEAASIRQSDAEARAAAQHGETHIRVPNQNASGQGFDEVRIIFGPDGKARINLVEVKDYPGRYVPGEDFTAIRNNLETNLDRLETDLESALRQVKKNGGTALGMNEAQIKEALRAIGQRDIDLDIRLGPETRLGAEDAGTVVKNLRRDIARILDVTPSDLRIGVTKIDDSFMREAFAETANASIVGKKATILAPNTPQPDPPVTAETIRTGEAALTRDKTEVGAEARAVESEAGKSLEVVEQNRALHQEARSELSTLERIEEVTGVKKGAEYDEAMANLRTFYEQQAEEAKHVVEVQRQRLDPIIGGGAYGINSRYDVREFSHGVTGVTIKVYLDGTRVGGDADALARIQNDARAGIDKHFNLPNNHLPNGNRLHVELEFVTNPADAHLTVEVRPGRGRATQTTWFVDSDPTVHAHELGHQMGLLDEYVDPQAVRRATATSPGVHTDDSLMADFWSKDASGNYVFDASGKPVANPLTALQVRHLEQIGNDIEAQKSAASPTPAVPAPAPRAPVATSIDAADLHKFAALDATITRLETLDANGLKEIGKLPQTDLERVAALDEPGLAKLAEVGKADPAALGRIAAADDASVARLSQLDDVDLLGLGQHDSKALTELGKLTLPQLQHFVRLSEVDQRPFAVIASSDPAAFAKFAGVERAGLANLSRCGEAAMREISKLSPATIQALSRLAPLELDRFVGLEPAARLKFDGLSEAALQRFGRLEPSELEKFGGLRFADALVKFGDVPMDGLKRLAELDRSALQKFGGWDADIIKNIAGLSIENIRIVASLNVAPGSAKVNAILGFQGRRLTFGSDVFIIDRAGLLHILERHHPKFWNGSVKVSQSFLDPKLTLDDIVDIIDTLMQQNRARIMATGTRGMYQLEGKYNGVDYVLGLNRGRVGQLYPK